MTILPKISATVAVFGVAAGYSFSFGHAVLLISKRGTSITVVLCLSRNDAIVLSYENMLRKSSYISPEIRIPVEQIVDQKVTPSHHQLFALERCIFIRVRV